MHGTVELRIKEGWGVSPIGSWAEVPSLRRWVGVRRGGEKNTPAPPCSLPLIQAGLLKALTLSPQDPVQNREAQIKADWFRL